MIVFIYLYIYIFIYLYIYIVCGNEIIEYCVADVCTCFCMQATEQVAMPLTYLIRRNQTRINYVYVFNLCLI